MCMHMCVRVCVCVAACLDSTSVWTACLSTHAGLRRMLSISSAMTVCVQYAVCCIAVTHQVDPTTSTDKKPPTSVHPSLVSILGWRFHQLLTVLPNRRREAEAWAGLAQSAWSKSGPVAALGPLDAALGSADVLTGKGREGAGLLVSLPPRRALPLMTP